MTQEIDEALDTYIARGPNCFGFGDTLSEACENCRKYAPSKNKHNTDEDGDMIAEVFKIHPDTEISEMTGALSYPVDHPPVKLGDAVIK
jgi:hypothetical protein